MPRKLLALSSLLLLGLSAGGLAQASITLVRPARVFDGDPTHDVSAPRRVKFVMKNGTIYKR